MIRLQRFLRRVYTEPLEILRMKPKVASASVDGLDRFELRSQFEDAVASLDRRPAVQPLDVCGSPHRWGVTRRGRQHRQTSAQPGAGLTR